MAWKDLKLWKKGSIIGFVFAMIEVAIWVPCYLNVIRNCSFFGWFFNLPLLNLNRIFIMLNIHPLNSNWLFSPIGGAIQWTLVGILFGFLVSRAKLLIFR